MVFRVITILLSGKDGQVGWELERTLSPLGTVVSLDHAAMDLAKPDSIRNAVRQIRPNLIINAAGYTSVDRAESDSDNAIAVNGVAPGILAEESKRINASLVHFSTDAVFNGEKGAPYTEEDAPCPINIYGQSKLFGEIAIQEVGVPHIIFRTSWVYGARGHNFARSILKLSAERDEITVVDDQVGAPTWSRMIAETTAMIIAGTGILCGRSNGLDQVSGIYNMTAGGYTSWFDFAVALIERAHILGKNDLRGVHTKRANVIPVRTSEYQLIAKRSLYSVLDNEKLWRTFSFVLPGWCTQLELCFQSWEDLCN